MDNYPPAESNTTHIQIGSIITSEKRKSSSAELTSGAFRLSYHDSEVGPFYTDPNIHIK